ncbi:MAG TPA: flagellin [Candidatus Paceibacterota bacterium]|nr:flagellin [Verrucomicrobiota bacterium]HRY46480.1 flagellin [Candidatus Paceibacterota bacterium]
MVINTNTQAQAAANQLRTSQTMLSKSLSRLSSGSKIVNPADDAAGLAVAMRLDAQVKRIDAARYNVGNAVSFTQTQDGYLKKLSKALDRMSELCLLAQDVTKGDADRALYNQEFEQLQDFITTTASREFNGVSLFSANTLNVTTDSEGGTFPMEGIDMSIAAYTNATGTTNISTTSAAMTALSDVRGAINHLASDRARIGAYQSRLSYTAEQLTVSKENLMAASSVIQDVDVAEESTQYARFQILVQAGTAMLAQANALPQNVLRLLQ